MVDIGLTGLYKNPTSRETETAPMTTQTQCQECGNEFQAKRGHQQFCCTACRKTWNNRRAVRGAELYDFVMNWRFERKETLRDGTTVETAARAMMGRLAEMYRESDRTRRSGRRSYNTFRDAMHGFPLARSEGEGDGR